MANIDICDLFRLINRKAIHYILSLTALKRSAYEVREGGRERMR